MVPTSGQLCHIAQSGGGLSSHPQGLGSRAGVSGDHSEILSALRPTAVRPQAGSHLETSSARQEGVGPMPQRRFLELYKTISLNRMGVFPPPPHTHTPAPNEGLLRVRVGILQKPF